MNLAGVELVEDLHQDEGVEHDGVVLRWRGVEGGVPAAVDVKQPLTCERGGQRAEINKKIIYYNINIRISF